MDKSTRTGLVLIAVGLIVPQIIDAIETANRLDIKRDFGVLPWLIMTAIGTGILLRSMIKYLRNRNTQLDGSLSDEYKP